MPCFTGFLTSQRTARQPHPGVPRHLLAASGKAIFFCSPVLETVEKVCTHLVLLRQGQLVASGAMEEILASRSALKVQQPPNHQGTDDV